MKTITFFITVLFFFIQSQAQISNYYLYSFPFQHLFEPNEEIPFVTFSIGYENDYSYIETKVCQYKKIRIDYCLCWDPEFYITEVIEESGEPCENQENRLFEQDYFSSFEIDGHWYYWDENLENGEHHFHLTGDMVVGQPYITYTNTLMQTADEPEIFKINVFPNPSVDRINFSEEVRTAVIFDLTGNIVMKIESPSDHLDISKLPKGAYIIKGLSNRGQFFVEKIIKK